MPVWRRGIVFEMHETDRKIVRFRNVKDSEIATYEVVKKPSNATVTHQLTDQDIEFAISGVQEGTYEIGPRVTFDSGEIKYFPAIFEVWD